MRCLTSPRNSYAPIVLLLAFFLAQAVFADAFAGPVPAAAPTGTPVLMPVSDLPISLIFPEPTSVREIYSAVGKAFGIRVLFDPDFKDHKTSVEFEEVTLEQCLGLLTRSSGHFRTVFDPKTVLIADDTPQNHRTYDQQVVRVFTIENIALKDAMTMIRSLVGAKNVAANEALNSLILRDTAARVEVAGRILEIIDQHRGEVAIDVAVLYLDGKKAERSFGDYRLSGREFEKLLRSSRKLAGQELSILDNADGLWTLRDLATSDSTQAASEDGASFELRIRPRVHALSGEVTLELAFDVGERRIESGMRLVSGESFLLTGLTTPSSPKDKSGEVVVVLTPRIVREPGFTASDLAAICVGTETKMELCGEQPIRQASAHSGE